MNDNVLGYPNGFTMRHNWSPNISGEQCVLCGYAQISHGPNATCEACGSVAQCDFFPKYDHPRKILICESCLRKEIKAAVDAKKEREDAAKMSNVKTPGEYYVNDTPSIKEINDMVNADDSIKNKAEKVCEIIKERILNCQQNILELNQKTREKQKEQNEFQIYLNHKMKEISLEKQKELGLNNIDYKPPKATKAPSKAPSTKKMDMDKLKSYAAQFNIPIEALRNIAVARQVSIEEAAKVYIQITNAVDEAKVKQA